MDEELTHRLAAAVSPSGLTHKGNVVVPATIDVVRNAAHRERLETIGVPEQRDASHIGALVARGEVPRRALCGIEAVLSNGDRVSAGGAVLKDVVGYDLATVLLGSMGRLAIIV